MVEVKVMGIPAVEEPAGEGYRGKEASGKVGHLTIN